VSAHPRDERGRFASGMNSLFRARTSMRVGVVQPASHIAMNDRLRAGSLPSSDARAGDVEPGPTEGLDSGAGRDSGGVDLASPGRYMTAAIRAQAGRGPQPLGVPSNGLPIRVE
jgi:hypothetical protein